jgi:hypothetical protein
MWRCADASTCSPLPSSGSRGRPLREPCGSPPLSVLWVRKTARLPVAVASGLPWQQVSARRGFVRFLWGVPSSPGTWSSSGWAGPTPILRQRQGALLGSREIPLEACPVLETPATPGQPRSNGCPDAALRLVNGVGIATMDDFGAEFITACFLAVYASHPPVTRRMATLATGLPATALTGLDLHQLDFSKRFH